jgi:LCP family protein required for cell wall assembly
MVPVLLLCGALGALGAAYLLGHRLMGHERFSPVDQTRNFWNIAANPESFFPGVERLNILCLGLDRNWDRKNQPFTKNVRSDTMIVVSLDLNRRTVSALSIPRDSRVRIPDYGLHKINDAHQIGGVDLAIDTVREFLEIPIDYYVVVKLGAVEKVIDAMGGLQIDVEKEMKYDDSWGHLHIDLKAGPQRLSGHQVEGYMRFRKDAEGDYGRMRRQQQVMRALASQVRTPATLLKLDTLIDLFNQNVESNLSRPEMMALARMFYQTPLDQIATASLPARNLMLDGIAYLDVYEEQKDLLVDWLLRGDDHAQNRLIDVDVCNGCRSSETAMRINEQLRLEQVNSRYRGRADRSDYEFTRIIDHGHHPRAGVRIGQLLGISRIEVDKTEGGPDVTVIVGRDQLDQRAASASAGGG